MSDQLPLFDASKAMVEYHSPDGQALVVQFDPDGETTWFTSRQIASLYHLTTQAVGQQVRTYKKQYPDDTERTIKKFFIVAEDGKQREVEHYNMDVVIFIGQRAQANEITIPLRKWFTEIIKQHFQRVGKAPRQFMPRQSPMFRRRIDAGETPEEAENAAIIRETLKETTKQTNAVRQEHGAEGADYARLNALDSKVATGKTPRQWKNELGEEVTPADYLSPLDNITLAYEKRKAARTHETNQSRGAEELERDIIEIAPEVKENREIMCDLLKGLTLTPQRKGEQLALKGGTR